MNWFNLNLRKVFFWLAAGLLPLISINMQQQSPREAWFEEPFSFLAGSLQSVFFDFSDGVRGTTSLYLNLIDIKHENARLKEQTQALQAQLQDKEELLNENARLSLLLDFKAKTKMELLAARVMSRDLLTDHATIRINKGTHHGLRSGQAVISTHGVVGYVFRPSAFTSNILLITDRYSVVDGVVARSRAKGIVEGKGPDLCALRYVEKSEDIQKGDLIVTSGLDNIFPRGFPIATVEDVEAKKFAAVLRVDLKPIVDPNKLDDVFVIMNAADEDLSEHVSARK